MHKCNLCGQKYPAATMVRMVQLENKKAYVHLVCPACRGTALNNPHYYMVVEDVKDKDKDKDKA